MIVLIDNDELVIMSWRMSAKKANIELLAFASVDEFLKHNSEIPKETEIYIDSELDDDKRGEIEAHKIFNLGFENLFLASGKTFEASELPSYFKGRVSKRPQF